MINLIIEFLIPSVFYMVSNNLDSILSQHMDAVTQQILLQNKILVTSIMWCIIFNKKFEKKQWLALIFLTIGSVFASIDNKNEILKKDIINVINLPNLSTTTTGLALILLYCICSASGALYCEYLYKYKKSESKSDSDTLTKKENESKINSKSSDSIHRSNIAMYVGGLFVNYTTFIYQQLWSEQQIQLQHSNNNINFFITTKGWNKWTYIDCINKMLLGLTLGFVMKYLSNIHKLFMFGCSMFSSAILEIISNSSNTKNNNDLNSNNFSLSIERLIGMLMILFSLVLYNLSALKEYWAKSSHEKDNVTVEMTSKKDK